MNPGDRVYVKISQAVLSGSSAAQSSTARPSLDPSEPSTTSVLKRIAFPASGTDWATSTPGSAADGATRSVPGIRGRLALRSLSATLSDRELEQRHKSQELARRRRSTLAMRAKRTLGAVISRNDDSFELTDEAPALAATAASAAAAPACTPSSAGWHARGHGGHALPNSSAPEPVRFRVIAEPESV